jgi:hypothetical protein
LPKLATGPHDLEQHPVRSVKNRPKTWPSWDARVHLPGQTFQLMS